MHDIWFLRIANLQFLFESVLIRIYSEVKIKPNKKSLSTAAKKGFFKY